MMAERQYYDDSFLWCEDCGQSRKGCCPQHGQLICVKDRTIPSRARLTLPHHLAIKTLELRAGGKHLYGVFAKKMIQARTQFGPVEGIESNTLDDHDDDQIKLKLFNREIQWQYLNCSNESECNWMMFVRAAHTTQEQNMVVYQYSGELFFVTTKPVPPGKELRVWYATEYATLMGELPLTSKGQSSIQEDSKGQQTSYPLAQDSNDRLLIKEPVENSGYISEDDIEDSYDISDGEKEAWRSVDTLADESHDTHKEETVKEHRDDTSTSCTMCHEQFSSPSDQKLHLCTLKSEVTTTDNLEMEGRRTRSKRKGKPKKVAAFDISKVKKDGKKSKLFSVPKLKVKRTRRPRMEKPENRMQQLLSCPDCDKVFAKDSKLKIHMYKHTGERPFKCSAPNCDKAFTCKFKLGRHELVHSQKRDFTCSYCSKAFARKDHLQTHLKSHDPEKSKYICELCGREYQSIQGYKTHRAMHSAESGDLTCGVCSKSFSSKELLMDHLKVHTGARSAKGDMAKKFICPFCSKAFYTAKDLRRHTVVHTKVREFLCQFCPQRFGRRDHLVRHLRRTHQTEITSNPQDSLINSTEMEKSLKSAGVKVDKISYDIGMKDMDFDYIQPNDTQNLLDKDFQTNLNRFRLKDRPQKDTKDASVDSLLHRVMFNQVPTDIQHDHGYLHSGGVNSNLPEIPNGSHGLNSVTDPQAHQFSVDMNQRLHSLSASDIRDIYAQTGHINYQNNSVQQDTVSTESLLASMETLKALGHFPTVNLSQLVQTTQGHLHSNSQPLMLDKTNYNS